MEIYEEGIEAEDLMRAEFERFVEALKSNEFIKDRIEEGMPIDSVRTIADAVANLACHLRDVSQHDE